MTLSPTLAALRFGYGLPLPPGAADGASGILAGLQGPDRMRTAWPLPGLAKHLPQLQATSALRKAQKSKEKDDDSYKAALGQLDDLVILSLRSSVARALDAPDGFRERLVAFWANHFCTQAKDRVTAYLPALMIEEAIRPNLTGRFADLLIAATTHPAMVVYLDQNVSVGPKSDFARKRKVGLNENLAREVMELHSMGVEASYSQADVRQMAELLTGLTFDPDTGADFDPRRVEPGAEEVLGRTYDGAGLEPIRAVLGDLAARPETAAHIATKLARHFLADVPPPAVVDRLTRAYLDTGGDLMAVYGALLTAPEAETLPLTKVRWPQDYLITGLRALGLGGAEVMEMADGPFRRSVRRALAAMGQPWLMPAGPNGFPEAAGDWINPPYLAARIAWSMRAPTDMGLKIRDPMAVLDRALGPRASPALRTAVARAETRTEAVGLILASTEMNRR